MVLVPEERGTIGACVIGVREVSQSSRVEVSEGGEEAQATLGTERGRSKKNKRRGEGQKKTMALK